MHDISKVSEGFIGRREAGIGYTISQSSQNSFLVPGALCYGIVFKRFFADFAVFRGSRRGLCILGGRNFSLALYKTQTLIFNWTKYPWTNIDLIYPSFFSSNVFD